MTHQLGSQRKSTSLQNEYKSRKPILLLIEFQQKKIGRETEIQSQDVT